MHNDSVNAQRMRPYMPGAVGEGGLIRGGLAIQCSVFVYRNSADPSRVYLTERTMLAVQIPRIVFGGIVSIVCVLHKSAISDIFTTSLLTSLRLLY